MKGSDDKRRHHLIFNRWNRDISELERFWIAFILLGGECSGCVVVNFLVVGIHVSQRFSMQLAILEGGQYIHGSLCTWLWACLAVRCALTALGKKQPQVGSSMEDEFVAGQQGVKTQSSEWGVRSRRGLGTGAITTPKRVQEDPPRWPKAAGKGTGMLNLEGLKNWNNGWAGE